MDWSHARGFPRLNYIIIISVRRVSEHEKRSRAIFFKPFAAGQTRPAERRDPRPRPAVSRV
jgi:hypothetical protein